MKGRAIGDHVIDELDLFDRNLTAENIAFSASGNDSHTIAFAAGAFRQKNSNMTMGDAQSGEGSNFGAGDGSRHSPRSTLTEKKKLERQQERLDQLRAQALAKMEGLDHFIFMIWSKFKLSEKLSDDELLAEFKKRFSHCLPLTYVDLVLVSSLKPKEEEKPEEEPKDPVSE